MLFPSGQIWLLPLQNGCSTLIHRKQTYFADRRFKAEETSPWQNGKLSHIWKFSVFTTSNVTICTLSISTSSGCLGQLVIKKSIWRHPQLYWGVSFITIYQHTHIKRCVATNHYFHYWVRMFLKKVQCLSKVLRRQSEIWCQIYIFYSDWITVK